MQLNKNDLIKDGEIIFAVFCVLGSVVYVKQVSDVKDSPAYDLKEVLKHYRKIEIMIKWNQRDFSRLNKTCNNKQSRCEPDLQRMENQVPYIEWIINYGKIEYRDMM